MIAMSILDVLTRDGAGKPDTDPRQVVSTSALLGTLVDFVIADFQRLLDLERAIGSFEGLSLQRERELNESVYAAYREWAANAEHVFARVRNLDSDRMAVAKVQALRELYGRVRARLLLTPVQAESASRQIREGKGIPMKELRDELHARVRA